MPFELYDKHATLLNGSHGVLYIHRGTETHPWLVLYHNVIALFVSMFLKKKGNSLMLFVLGKNIMLSIQIILLLNADSVGLKSSQTC